MAVTLIELLVAVALIALLAAILVPALGRARAHARLSLCGANLHDIATALTAYTVSCSDYYPYGGAYEKVRKPCPERLLRRAQPQALPQKLFFCPEDRSLTMAQAEAEYGSFTASRFWYGGDDMGQKRYVRHLFRFDQSPPVEETESSYIWCEHVLSEPAQTGNIFCPSTLGVVSEGRHVVNRWEWASLHSDDDCRADQTHLDGMVNVLFADSHVESCALKTIGDIRCTPH